MKKYEVQSELPLNFWFAYIHNKTIISVLLMPLNVKG